MNRLGARRATPGSHERLPDAQAPTGQQRSPAPRPSFGSAFRAVFGRSSQPPSGAPRTEEPGPAHEAHPASALVDLVDAWDSDVKRRAVKAFTADDVDRLRQARQLADQAQRDHPGRKTHRAQARLAALLDRLTRPPAFTGNGMRAADIADLAEVVARLSAVVRGSIPADRTDYVDALRIVRERAEQRDALSAGERAAAAGPQPAHQLTAAQADNAAEPPPTAPPESCYVTLVPDAPMTVVGSGVSNTVHRTAAILHDGSRREVVFKDGHAPLDRSFAELGIDVEHPNWHGRNLASYLLDQELGLGVTARTWLVREGDGLGLAMEVAPGVSLTACGKRTINVDRTMALRLQADPELLAKFAMSKGFSAAEVDVAPEDVEAAQCVVTLKVDEVRDSEGRRVSGRYLNVMDLANSEVRRQLTLLQILDALTGQWDRHPGNYFVHVGDDGQVRVTGIDNDMAFPATNRDFDYPLHYMARLPGVIDSRTARALRALSAARVRSVCARLLSGREVEAVIRRLDRMKQWVDRLERDGAIVPDDANWSSPEIGTRLCVEEFNRGDNPAAVNVYVANACGLSYVAGATATQNVMLHDANVPIYGPPFLEDFVAAQAQAQPQPQ